MIRSIQEELLAVLWFILALLLWRYDHKILSVLTLLKGVECTICSIVFAIIGRYQKHKRLQALKGGQTEGKGLSSDNSAQG